jgi:SAM-dependent methyltransferase
MEMVSDTIFKPEIVSDTISAYTHDVSEPEVVVNEEVLKLQDAVDGLLRGRAGLRILEAGCGSASRLTFPPDSYVTGIDICQEQLDRNEILSEKFLGDIQTYDLPESGFDIIVCWDVLEHLSTPEKALANFARAIKPDGLIILAFPSPRTVKGLITKLTPHWFHIWAYRHIFGHPLAGVGGRAPFETFMRWSLSPRAIRRLASEKGLAVEYFVIYEGYPQRRLRSRLKVTGPIWWIVKMIPKVLSLGFIDAERTDCLVVLRKT